MLTRYRKHLRVLAGALFVVAGAAHFVMPEFYLRMMPSFLPAPEALVIISGICEMLGGLGLLLEKTRQWAGYGLIALLLAVFPANVHLALNYASIEGAAQTPFAYWIRLPFQAVFIAWVMFVMREGSDEQTGTGER